MQRSTSDGNTIYQRKLQLKYLKHHHHSQQLTEPKNNRKNTVITTERTCISVDGIYLTTDFLILFLRMGMVRPSRIHRLGLSSCQISLNSVEQLNGIRCDTSANTLPTFKKHLKTHLF